MISLITSKCHLTHQAREKNMAKQKQDRKKLWAALAAVARKADEEARPFLRQQLEDWTAEDAQAEKAATKEKNNE